MRVILHCDLNNFFASVECILNPSLRGKCVGVTGDVESRHGIILAKSEKAKLYGVKTGMTLNEAKKVCPDIIFCPSHHDKYQAYSKLVKKIYTKYTDYIESFGIDECWLDCTSTVKLLGSGEEIAYKIKEEVKNTLGLTISVGVSFNKVFAKLGSDLKKPDAVTVISKENFKDKVWPLPVSDMLYVGRSMTEKLHKINVYSIGELANCSREYLENKFGKWGGVLHDYANGNDLSPVSKYDESDEIKSVGNSLTTYRDLVTFDDIKIVFSVLSESISERLINHNLYKATILSIYVRDSNLISSTRQCKLPFATELPSEFTKTAYNLFVENYGDKFSVRTLGISVSGFVTKGEQITFESENIEKKSKLNSIVLDIKKKYGQKSVLKGIVLKDKKIMRENPHDTE